MGAGREVGESSFARDRHDDGDEYVVYIHVRICTCMCIAVPAITDTSPLPRLIIGVQACCTANDSGLLSSTGHEEGEAALRHT
jgi:hypothetical protein